MKQILLSAALFCSFFMASAQDTGMDTPSAEKGKNLVKLNLSSLILNNYSFQYERVITKRISAAIGYRFMPSSDVPFKSTVLNQVGDDEAADFIINNSKFSNMAITPEIRIYLGEGYGKGFYVAPYYRYSKFKMEEVRVNYQDSNGQDQYIKMDGDITGNSAGLMFGAQWTIGQHFVIDWWIAGGHIGGGSGDISGTSTAPLSPQDQARVKDILDDFDVPLVKTTNEVTANGAKVKMDGTWAGIRAFGLNVGYRF